MIWNIRKLSISLTLLTLVYSIAVDPNDLLLGKGLFQTQSLSDFQQDSHHHTSFLVVNSTNVLKLQKPSTSDVSFQTGLQYKFVASKPSHISFEFSSVSPDTEDANLRLIDSTTGHTVLLFRAGKAGFIRVNENQMISFYNSSVSTDANVKTIKMDILLYWNSSTINVFVQGQWKGSATFFQTADSVDTLKLYNLYQSTSYWKNLVVCSSICYSFNSEYYSIFSFSLLTILIMILFY